VHHGPLSTWDALLGLLLPVPAAVAVAGIFQGYFLICLRGSALQAGRGQTFPLWVSGSQEVEQIDAPRASVQEEEAQVGSLL
jgi:hypothetical protein